jgi:hypothetical protein
MTRHQPVMGAQPVSLEKSTYGLGAAVDFRRLARSSAV